MAGLSVYQRTHLWQSKQAKYSYSLIMGQEMHASMLLNSGTVYSTHFHGFYSSDSARNGRLVVDSMMNGEDVLFNFVVTNATGLPPLVVKSRGTRRSVVPEASSSSSTASTASTAAATTAAATATAAAAAATPPPAQKKKKRTADSAADQQQGEPAAAASDGAAAPVTAVVADEQTPLSARSEHFTDRSRLFNTFAKYFNDDHANSSWRIETVPPYAAAWNAVTRGGSGARGVDGGGGDTSSKKKKKKKKKKAQQHADGGGAEDDGSSGIRHHSFAPTDDDDDDEEEIPASSTNSNRQWLVLPQYTRAVEASQVEDAWLGRVSMQSVVDSVDLPRGSILYEFAPEGSTLRLTTGQLYSTVMDHSTVRAHLQGLGMAEADDKQRLTHWVAVWHA